MQNRGEVPLFPPIPTVRVESDDCSHVSPLVSSGLSFFNQHKSTVHMGGRWTHPRLREAQDGNWRHTLATDQTSLVALSTTFRI